MNIRTEYLSWFMGICFSAVLINIVSESLIPQYPAVRFVPLASLLAAMIAVLFLFRYFRGRLPPASPKQLTRAIRSSRRLGWIYVGGIVFGLLTEGREILSLPHAMGFLLPLIPIGLAAFNFRNAALLSRKVAEAQSQDQPFN
jgi:hypothetical protein